MTNHTIFIGKKPDETQAEADARMKTELAAMKATHEKKADLLKKWGME